MLEQDAVYSIHPVETKSPTNTYSKTYIKTEDVVYELVKRKANIHVNRTDYEVTVCRAGWLFEDYPVFYRARVNSTKILRECQLRSKREGTTIHDGTALLALKQAASLGHVEVVQYFISDAVVREGVDSAL
ncbi:hypothetical protein HK102_005304, partial [Quaeritorhiza haematococci]